MEEDLCFLCSSGSTFTNFKGYDGNNYWTGGKTASSFQLENNLDVIFLMRNLLHVPSIQLESQLRKTGDNPENWIRLCDQCTQLTRKARRLYQEIRKIEKELRSVQKQVLDKITAGGSQEDEDLENSPRYFVNKIRSEVKNYNYNVMLDKEEINPGFLEGDKLAKYLDSQRNHCTAAIVLVQKPPCEVDQDEIKIEQESPPMSPEAEDSPDQFVEEDDPDINQNPDLKPDKNVGKAEKVNCSCSICGLKFISQNGLGRHVKAVHRVKHQDDLVTKKLEEETGLFLHGGNRDMDKKNEKRFKCKYCDLGFRAKLNCKRHQKTHHEEKGKVRTNKTDGKTAKDKDNQFKCEICSKTFRLARNWSTHLWNMHDKREITCPYAKCGMIFNDNLVEFRKHWKTTHAIGVRNISEDGLKYPCSYCGKEFGSRNYLSYHQKNQHLSNPGEKFICEICGVEKKSKDNLNQHKNKAHKLYGDEQLSSSSPGGKFTCGICGNVLNSQRGLWEHKRKIHRVGRNGKAVVTRRRRRRKTVEKGISKFLCNLCGKEYNERGNYAKHVRFVHEKQFSLSCHVCGLKFWNTSQLKMHLLQSHRDDPVAVKLEEEEGLKFRECPVVGCYSKFVKQDALDKHVERLHAGGGSVSSSRFPCKYCGKGFRYKYKLRTHERMHEGKGRDDFKCELCGKGFGTKAYLRYHQLMTHKQAKKFQKI